MSTAETAVKAESVDSLPTNPRFFPDDRRPEFILKGKNGNIHFLMHEPDGSRQYLWYMSSPTLVSVEQLRKEMAVSGRRWYATDRAGYEMQLSVRPESTTEDGAPYVCLRHIRQMDKYWFGPRHEEPAAEPVVLILTVAELYLKSELHQKRLMRILMRHICRVLGTLKVYRNGRTMIEVRAVQPTAEQMALLSLLPGIAKIYAARPGIRDGDMRGELLHTGAGGIPIIPEQAVLALISGGIDSPVAAYRMMTRGCYVRGIHFLNSTSSTASVVQKNRRICEQLSRIQGRFEMHYVDISGLQAQIVAQVPNHNRTLLYKWLMLSLGSTFDDARFLVTGDSAGQVASQTVFNIGTLYASVSKAVVAPLIGSHKNEIVDEARRIGTYDFSIQEGADCCQYMMCKTGANLWIGHRSLDACARRITLAELPVTREVFTQGQLSDWTNFHYTPTQGLRREMPVLHSSGPTETPPDASAPVVNFDAAAGTTMPRMVKDVVYHATEANPNSMYSSGRQARMAVERVRTELATAMGVPASDLIFTSGGTESNNIALHGYRVQRDAWSHASTMQAPDVAADAPVVRVVDLVNHETGSVTRDLRRPAEVARLHVDASQALCKIDFKTLDLSQVDSMTVTAHKINGPIGVGALYLRNLKCNKMYSGGSQEHGIRPGTENVAAILGFGAALRLDRTQSMHREIEHLVVSELTALGCEIDRRGETSGFIVHATLPEGLDNTEVVSMLSARYGVEIGTGSACKTGELNDTVYTTLGKAPAPRRSIRLSWDAFATIADAEVVVDALRRTMVDLKGVTH